MNDKDLKDLVNNQWERVLEWNEPWNGVDSLGNLTNAHVTMSATVADCIRMTRYQRYATFKKEVPTEGALDETKTMFKVMGATDEQLLHDFIVVNWAWVREDDNRDD